MTSTTFWITPPLFSVPSTLYTLAGCVSNHMVNFLAPAKSWSMNKLVAPLSKSTVTPLSSAMSVIWISPLVFSKFSERVDATIKCFWRAHSQHFSYGEGIFQISLVDVSLSFTSGSPISEIWFVSSVSGVIDRAENNWIRAARAHPSLAVWHKILWIILLHHLFISNISHISGDHTVLQQLLLLFCCHEVNIFGLGTLPSKVSNLATVLAGEGLWKLCFYHVNVH